MKSLVLFSVFSIFQMTVRSEASRGSSEQVAQRWGLERADSAGKVLPLEGPSGNQHSIDLDKMKSFSSKIRPKSSRKVTVSSPYGKLLRPMRKVQLESEGGEETFGDLLADIKVGSWCNTIYRGRWKSTLKNQAGHILTSEGATFVSFEWNPELVSNVMSVNLRILEGELIEERSIELTQIFEMKNSDQTSLEGTTPVAVSLKDKIFSVAKNMKCEGKLRVELTDQEGKPAPISTDDPDSLHISIEVALQGCEISFGAKTTIGGQETLLAILFTFFGLGSIGLGILPFINALQNENLNSLAVLSDYTLLGNYLIDLILLMINMSLSVRFMLDYFLWFSMLTMALLISVLLKMRFYMYISDLRVETQPITLQQKKRSKLINLIIFIVLSIVSLTIGGLSLVKTRIFWALFLYMGFQIYWNAFYVLGPSCFTLKIHLCLFIPQVTYPLMLRALPSRFFLLKPDPVFCAVQVLIAVFFVSIMLCQRIFGSKFFIHKRCLPNHYDYYRKFTDSQADIESCPICLFELNQAPNDGRAPKRFMTTPCGHSFHPSCLEAWMIQSMVCPCCRTQLPPF